MSLILSGTDGLSDVDGTAATPALRGTDANTGIFFPAADTIAFSEGGVEAARFDSAGNFGLGTSPAVRLDVSGAASSNGDARFVAKLADTSAVAQGNGGGIMFRGVYTGTTLVDAAGIQAYKANATDNNYSYGLAFSTRADGGNLTANMRLNESGNLGLGVTPVASVYTPSRNFFVGQATNLIGRSTINFTSLNTNVYEAPTTSAPTYINSSTAAAQYQQYLGVHSWSTAPAGTAGNAISFTQAMTLDASGNLGIGTTSPASKLTVSNGTVTAGIQPFTPDGVCYFGTTTNHGLAFLTNGAERARIDSSGNLLVGTTSTSGNAGFQVLPNANATGSALFSVNHVTGSASGHLYASFNYDGSGIGSITQSGTTAVLYNVTSDQRLKENIVDAPEFGSVIDSLQVRSFDWKAEGSHQRAGFIAQELVTVAPEAVHQPANPDDMMAVDYSKLVPMLVKEIQSLRKRLAAAGI